MDFFLKNLDKALDVLWRLIYRVLIFSLRYFRIALIILGKIWSQAAKKPKLKFIDNKLELIKKKLANSPLPEFQRKCSLQLERLADLLSSSKVARRWFFAILAILLLLFIYPPQTWGPWYKYQTGIASYYGKDFWGKKTANGETFTPGYTAAHKTLPLGITVKVVNLENGRTVYVRINDRGPYKKGRILDLNQYAAEKLGMIEKGTAQITIYTHKKY
jgi:hypothetical protein